jgi:hypothetical protein
MKQLAVFTCGAALVIVSAAIVSTQDAARADPALRAEIHQIEAMLPNAPDRGAVLYLLANRYTTLGEHDRAFALLRECLSLHEGFEPDTERLRPLRAIPRMSELIDQFRASHPSVHHAQIAFTVPQNDLFPEGLAHDRGRGLFYLGGAFRTKMVKVDANHHYRVSDLITDDRYHLAPVGGLRIDPFDHSIWAATDGPEFVHVGANGDLLGRFSTTDPGPHILNDLVVRRGGDIYVTDSRANLVYRFDRTTHTFTLLSFGRPLFTPNGITLSPDEHLLFVADDLGVSVLDLRTGESYAIRPGENNTLAGIDGLYWHAGGLVGVEYGTGAHRVMRWQLGPDLRRVTSSELLEYRTDLVSFPTTGAVVGDNFYFIGNTGIGNLRDGHIVDRTKLEPVHVNVVRLRR